MYKYKRNTKNKKLSRNKKTKKLIGGSQFWQSGDYSTKQQVKMRDQYTKEIETEILKFSESETDIKKIKTVLDLIKELELREPLSLEIKDKRTKLKIKLDTRILRETQFTKQELDTFFSGSSDFADIKLRIHNTNGCNTKLLSLIYNGELIEDKVEDKGRFGSEAFFEKLNGLKSDKEPALFSLNVKFYNFHLKDLSFKPGAIAGTIADFIHKEEDRGEMVDDFLGFSLPYKEEAIQILLYIGNIIISKNPLIQIVGGVNIDNAANKVSLLFSKPDTSDSSSPPPSYGTRAAAVETSA